MGERIRSEEVILVVNMLKVTCFILGLAHLIACIWYGIGATADTDSSWVWYYGYSDRSLSDRYIMSFHWSLVTFAGATQDVRSRNTGERAFEVIVAFIIFCSTAVFVSSLTSSLTRLQIISGSKSTQFIALRKYLSNRGISRRLMVRVQRNAQYVFMDKQRHMPEAEVELLSIISEPLRVELHYEEWFPVYKEHAFFAWYAQNNPAGMRKICHLATSNKTLSSGDILFTNSEIPSDPHLYIVLAGTMEYSTERKDTADAEADEVTSNGSEAKSKKIVSRGVKRAGSVAVEQKEEAHPGRHISEVVLWVPWVHRGVLKASAECRLLGCSAKIFHEIADQFASADCHPGLYAIEFCDRLKADQEDGVVPSDLLRPTLPYEIMPKVLNDLHPRRASTNSIADSWNAKKTGMGMLQRGATTTLASGGLNIISMAKKVISRPSVGPMTIRKSVDANRDEEAHATSSLPISLVPKPNETRSSTTSHG